MVVGGGDGGEMGGYHSADRDQRIGIFGILGAQPVTHSGVGLGFRLCCTKPLMSEVPLSPDGFIPRFL